MLDLADVVVAAFEIDVFDCHAFAGAFAEGAVDDAEGAACEVFKSALSSRSVSMAKGDRVLTAQLLHHLVVVCRHLGYLTEVSSIARPPLSPKDLSRLRLLTVLLIALLLLV